ncbi:MAG: cytochrome c oxidase subunit II [Bdellovibrionaceae bacterium]|nr:cytochrome c oxidase subunit II [Pseudobdellovibrionaceae bacterium]|tara:strand:- start:979 stop:2001 length:1023 start_codon:yes stop_codon:yes gene_type:complete
MISIANAADKFAGTLPIQGTNVATGWDMLYWFLIGVSVFFFVGTMAAMVFFAWKYRASSGAKPVDFRGNHLIEIIWTVIPTALVLLIFAWGWVVYKQMVHVPGDAMEIRVIGKQWLWQFIYDDGRKTVGEVYVPVNRPVKLILTSDDVIHGFFIPNFRVKKDVVPGMYTSVWFQAKVPGRHQVFCTEYCGGAHSGMLAKIYALPEADFQAWKRGKKVEVKGFDAELANKEISGGASSGGQLKKVSLADQGKKLTETKGCIACHSSDGSKLIGPSYKGLFGSKRVFTDGSSVVADENYIRESIENPGKKVVQGFAPSMPTFKGLVNEEELNAIISYIKSLK